MIWLEDTVSSTIQIPPCESGTIRDTVWQAASASSAAAIVVRIESPL